MCARYLNIFELKKTKQNKKTKQKKTKQNKKTPKKQQQQKKQQQKTSIFMYSFFFKLRIILFVRSPILSFIHSVNALYALCHF